MKAENTSTLSKAVLLPWFICCIGMLFYCFNYFLRVSPGPMESDLVDHLHITASQFGNLSALYYYAYTPMQIPVGMIYDRFGARLVLFFACMISVLGLAVFISAGAMWAALLGRFLIGFGTAFSYIGVLKIASVWLPPKRFSVVAGLTTAFGKVAAIFSVLFLTTLVQQIGYRGALISTLWVGIGLCVFILLFMRNKPKQSSIVSATKPMTFKQLFAAMVLVLSKPQMWLIGLIGCLFYLPASVFLDAWGIPFLKSVYQLTPTQAAHAISMTFVGWIIASPTIGAISERIERRRLPLMICSCFAALCFGIVFYAPNVSVPALFVLLFFAGIFCGAHPLCFALGKENSPTPILGTAVAITNFLIMLGGVVFQPLVGKMLDWHTEGNSMVNGLHVYSAGDYTYAVSVVPIGLALSIILTFFLKETNCKSYEEQREMNTDNLPDNVVPIRP